MKHSIGKDRAIERTVGCWNCKHWAPEAAAEFWLQRRVRDLTIANMVARDSPQGENDQRVLNIKKMVMSVDKAVSEAKFGLCLNPKAVEQDRLGDLVASAYLCTSGWSGAVGASLARAGAKLDKTATELIEDLDGAAAVIEQGLNK